MNEYLYKTIVDRLISRSQFNLLLFCIFSFVNNQNLNAQVPGNFGNNTPNQPKSNNSTEMDGPDSTIYNYVLLNDIFKPYSLEDSLASIKFLHRDPLQKDGQELINTGNRGSAAYPLLYNPNINIGFNAGYQQYDAYKLNLSEFRFYEQNRPMADLYFSQLADQQNITVGAEFSRNFSDGISFSLNYKRLSQKGFYANQDTKTTNFGAGIRYKSKNDKYNGIFVFIQNANEENHNGGILNFDDLNAQFVSNIPTILSEAKTRQQEQTYAFVQYYKLSKTQSNSWNLYLKNDLVYKPSYFNFGDNLVNDASDSLFYGNLAIDSRGIRRNLKINQLRNAFYVHGEKTQGIASRIGLIFDHYNIANLSDSIRNDLTLHYLGNVPILKKFYINIDGKLGLLNNAGNFDLNGKIEFQASKSLNLNGGVRFFNSEQSYNTQFLSLNNQVILNQGLDKSIGSILYGELGLPKLKFRASISQSVINKPVYWDDAGSIVQKDGLISVTSLNLMQNIRLWKIHLDNQLHFQILSDKIYPVPSYYSTHQLYYSSSLFKKVMDINFGLDMKLIGNYSGGQYQPVYGSYQLSNTSLPFFPAANLYLIARISSFRAILMMENFSQRFVNEFNFDVLNQPQFSSTFRFTVSWLLKD